MTMAGRILVTLRNEPWAKLDLVRLDRDWYELQYLGRNQQAAISFCRSELIEILRVALDDLQVDKKLVDSVLPKLSKANIVK